MGTFIAIIGGLLLLAVSYALSWGITIGLLYLITLCFNLTWSLPIATGIWLVIVVIKDIFHSNPKVTVKK